MATPFSFLLLTIAALATEYCAFAAPGNALAGDVNVVARAPAELVELVRWHSGLSVNGSDACVNPEWKSALSAIDPQDTSAFRVMHGADGLRGLAEDGIYFSLDALDAPKGGARQFVQDPASTQDGPARKPR